ncbi:hypothetical protein [Caballeronia sp. dw_19]|uniref:hypothetical protein n=1 Tax=Caballeronia sp. dw_19 TaxID=2719791 RepID=UPI001BCE94AF|nr:hypothetical protein [Caballeronia sp. dw_19]
MNAFIDANGVLVAWGYMEANNGDTLVEVPEAFNEIPGTVSTPDKGVTWVPYTAPVSPGATAVTALASGLTIASTATPALNGTYAIDQLSQMDIIAIETSINAGKGFPGGATVFNYADATGAFHSFTQANFTNFAAAIRDYVYELKSVIAGASTTLPSATSTIA